MNIQKAEKNPPFGWYSAWEVLDKDRLSDKTPRSAFKQPESIKISCRDTSSSTPHEVTANIIPDKGLLGCEYAMQHTFRTFDDQVLTRVDKKDVKTIYRLMYSSSKAQPRRSGTGSSQRRLRQIEASIPCTSIRNLISKPSPVLKNWVIVF